MLCTSGVLWVWAMCISCWYLLWLLLLGGNMPNPIRFWRESGLPREIMDVIRSSGYEVRLCLVLKIITFCCFNNANLWNLIPGSLVCRCLLSLMLSTWQFQWSVLKLLVAFVDSTQAGMLVGRCLDECNFTRYQHSQWKIWSISPCLSSIHLSDSSIQPLFSASLFLLACRTGTSLVWPRQVRGLNCQVPNTMKVLYNFNQVPNTMEVLYNIGCVWCWRFVFIGVGASCTGVAI